ncbi:hypothetical protein KAC08_004074 [Salmonella enterica subsp. diarizonae serovar 60:k:z]|nr:hypothetical protein [Salmonella enterica subsp. diarizonae]EHG2951811.1 hypothetical protein [Salmonella enterica subsp. diarizonae serovar 53:r:z35]EHJ0298555.1 hypothetical protein [Salmonella enterica subsp. diarizonae serovar 60:k:z]
MSTAEIQIHGYRKGHQLLASSTTLSREDQAVVDRLSDVTGPLRPKEQFEPYLTTYPLPSGIYYVVARTWQDLSVPRAGCVRTKSVLINMKDWVGRLPLPAVLQLLDPSLLPDESEAVCVELNEQLVEEYPFVSGFNTNEFLEALFLEEPKPVVVFDAPKPELIALRLLAALWPQIRQEFALSTFALSPRRIGGRDLDLVFSPSNAKARFSDWLGRRVDGRLLQAERHRWTKTIVHRVFDSPMPRMLSDNMLSLLGQRDLGNVSVLRVALLWDELSDKLNHTPSASLGLLDIANSGMMAGNNAIMTLEPRLVNAITSVKDNMSPEDSWNYLGAIVRKINGLNMPDVKTAVENLAGYLAEYSPEGAFHLLEHSDSDGAIDNLLIDIANGLSRASFLRVKQGLLKTSMDVFSRLVSTGMDLTAFILRDDELIKTVCTILTNLEQCHSRKVGWSLLPFLIEDRHFPIAKFVIEDMTSSEVIAELRWLGSKTGFQSRDICTALIKRAQQIGALSDVRDLLIHSDKSHKFTDLIAMTLEATEADVSWLLEEKYLSKAISTELLVDLLRKAEETQFEALILDKDLGGRIINYIPDDAVDIFMRAAFQRNISVDVFTRLIHLVLPKVDMVQQETLAKYALEKCLRISFGGDESEFLLSLLVVLGDRLDGRWVIREGIGKGVSAQIASRNIIVFEKAFVPVRMRIINSIDEMAYIMRERRVMDFTEEAYDASARLMFDAEKGGTSRKKLADAANTLIPVLLNARRQPVSLMIAALFPVVYQELAKSVDVPEDVNIFFYFMDWDRCKKARNELVHAFMNSSWRPGHLALTAYRCDEVSKIIKQVARSYEGENYLMKIRHDLQGLNEENRRIVKRKISEFM